MVGCRNYATATQNILSGLHARPWHQQGLCQRLKKWLPGRRDDLRAAFMNSTDLERIDHVSKEALFCLVELICPRTSAESVQNVALLRRHCEVLPPYLIPAARYGLGGELKVRVLHSLDLRLFHLSSSNRSLGQQAVAFVHY